MSNDQDNKNPFGSQILFVKIGSPKAWSEVLALGIDNITCDGLALIVQMKFLRVLTNHDLWKGKNVGLAIGFGV
jgi:hypothetical protein